MNQARFLDFRSLALVQHHRPSSDPMRPWNMKEEMW
eukprot:CAMPEP_0206491894 /NCGR_PEP_ID=MMETSP0324_2-20121206/45524_1 /ASSEMBLY_ACC=CAM_ASM_000836 /TAXON_ID=2866 /ORGANISM="Crypthecodinium cohnii, Strain Seligo" /LENGTH=35 /DNA_ID= /DNA_START= /DNA_END= /DNA_ORIENTATION=